MNVSSLCHPTTGATLAIIIDMELEAAVILSALIAIFYTWVGGLYSVAYTDVVQLGCILLGLVRSFCDHLYCRILFSSQNSHVVHSLNQVICIPFAWTHKAVEPITYDSQDWMGSLTPGWEWYYADYMLLLTFGGIPWQVYFQRVLSSKSAAGAEILSYIAAFGCIIMAVPPVLIGGIAKVINIKTLISFKHYISSKLIGYKLDADGLLQGSQWYFSHS